MAMTQDHFNAAALILPSQSGLNDELKTMLACDLTLDQAVALHLKNWNLSDEPGMALDPQPYFHDIAHILYALALLVPPQTKSLRGKLENVEYQGNMQVELAVRAIQFTGLSKLAYAHPLAKDAALTLLLRAADDPQAMETFATRGNNGQKAAFYIGRGQNRPMLDVRREHSFDDMTLFEVANTLAGEPSRPPFPGKGAGARPQRWYEKINDGDSYMCQGQAQTYKDITVPSADPDTAVIMDRLLPALDVVRAHLVTCAKQGVNGRKNPAIIGQIKVRTMLDAMVKSVAPALSGPKSTPA